MNENHEESMPASLEPCPPEIFQQISVESPAGSRKRLEHYIAAAESVLELSGAHVENIKSADPTFPDARGIVLSQLVPNTTEGTIGVLALAILSSQEAEATNATVNYRSSEAAQHMVQIIVNKVPSSAGMPNCSDYDSYVNLVDVKTNEPISPETCTSYGLSAADVESCLEVDNLPGLYEYIFRTRQLIMMGEYDFETHKFPINYESFSESERESEEVLALPGGELPEEEIHASAFTDLIGGLDFEQIIPKDLELTPGNLPELQEQLEAARKSVSQLSGTVEKRKAQIRSTTGTLLAKDSKDRRRLKEETIELARNLFAPGAVAPPATPEGKFLLKLEELTRPHEDREISMETRIHRMLQLAGSGKELVIEDTALCDAQRTFNHANADVLTAQGALEDEIEL